MTDSKTVTYFYSSLTLNMSAATDYARANAVDPTDLTTSAVGSETSTTDVVYYDSNYTTFVGTHGTAVRTAVCGA